MVLETRLVVTSMYKLISYLTVNFHSQWTYCFWNNNYFFDRRTEHVIAPRSQNGEFFNIEIGCKYGYHWAVQG